MKEEIFSEEKVEGKIYVNFMETQSTRADDGERATIHIPWNGRDPISAPEPGDNVVIYQLEPSPKKKAKPFP